MKGSIFVDGKEFISSIRAAKEIGYASDYVGQLSRAKKIPARLIGKTWYVDYFALAAHKKNSKFGKRKKIISEENTKKTNNIDAGVFFEVITPKSLKEVAVIYEKDEASRLPELIKKTAGPVSRGGRSIFFKIYVPLAITLVLTITVLVVRPAWLSPEPIKSASGRVALIMATYREPALAFSPLDWLKNFFSKKKNSANMSELASNFDDNQNGIVIFPETEDRIGISNRIKSIFSDKVDVAFDEDGDTGVIIPVFSSEDSFENYAFVIVPVPVKSSESLSSEKVQ